MIDKSARKTKGWLQEAVLIGGTYYEMAMESMLFRLSWQWLRTPTQTSFGTTVVQSRNQESRFLG